MQNLFATATPPSFVQHATKRGRQALAAAMLTSLAACGGGSSGGSAADLVFSQPCLSAFAGTFDDLSELAAATLDNLSAAQLEQLTDSLSSALGTPASTVTGLVGMVQSNTITEEVAECALQQGLAEQGIISPDQLPDGPLSDLLTNLPLGSALDDAIAMVTAGSPIPLDGIADLLVGIQTGEIDTDLTREITFQALTIVNEATPLLAVPDAIAPGLGDVLSNLDSVLPGGVDSLSNNDLFALAESVTTAVELDSISPVTAVLTSITSDLPVATALAVTEAVTSALSLNNIGQLFP